MESAAPAGRSGRPAARVHWKRQLHQLARHICGQLLERPQVRGIAIGGSLARGMEWRHSDVELGIVVTDHIPDLGHFNVQDQCGFEVFQLVEADWREQLDLARSDPRVVLHWPIQLYQCRIVCDEAGVLGPFKEIFDATLFRPETLAAKLEIELGRFDDLFARGRQDLQTGYPLSALAGLRDAFNSLILAFYWKHGILPRSQTRTDALLRAHCRRLGQPGFYVLFRQVYALRESARSARDLLAACRDDLELAVDVWGPGARDFFRFAVDGGFAWGIHDSVLTVHRLCVPICVRAVPGRERAFDDPAWRRRHGALCAFLALEEQEAESVPALFARVAEARAAFSA